MLLFKGTHCNILNDLMCQFVSQRITTKTEMLHVNIQRYLFLQGGEHPRAVVEPGVGLDEAVLEPRLAPRRVRLALVQLHDARARPVGAQHGVQAAVELLAPVVVVHLAVLQTCDGVKLTRVTINSFIVVNVQSGEKSSCKVVTSVETFHFGR